MRDKQSQARKILEKMTQAELMEFDAWLHERIETMGQASEVIEEKQTGSWTYKLQFVKCGRPGCKCATGQGHGPYWYGYRSVKNKTKAKYIGKEFKPLP
jgi:hypothetical protein